MVCCPDGALVVDLARKEANLLARAEMDLAVMVHGVRSGVSLSKANI